MVVLLKRDPVLIGQEGGSFGAGNRGLQVIQVSNPTVATGGVVVALPAQPSIVAPTLQLPASYSASGAQLIVVGPPSISGSSVTVPIYQNGASVAAGTTLSGASLTLILMY